MRLHSSLVEMAGFEPAQPVAPVLQTGITLPRYRISIEVIVPSKGDQPMVGHNDPLFALELFQTSQSERKTACGL